MEDGGTLVVEGRDHEWVVEYEQAREAARASADATIFVRAADELVRLTTGLVLKRMGEGASPDGRLAAILRAQELLPEHPEAFPNKDQSGSPKLALEWLYRAMWSLKKADLSGERIVLPADSGYRDLDHLANEIVDSAVTLLTAVTTPADPAAQEVDYEEGKSLVRRELASELAPGETMRRIVSWLQSAAPTEEWEPFGRVSFEDEVTTKRRLLLDAFASDRSLSPLEGFDFVISTPIRDGRPTYDIEVGAASAYDPKDLEWPHVRVLETADNWVRSQALDDIYDLARRAESTRGGAQVVALGYSLVLGRELAREFKREMGLARLGVCAGFAADTPVHLGWV